MIKNSEFNYQDISNIIGDKYHWVYNSFKTNNNQNQQIFFLFRSKSLLHSLLIVARNMKDCYGHIILRSELLFKSNYLKTVGRNWDFLQFRRRNLLNYKKSQFLPTVVIVLLDEVHSTYLDVDKNVYNA